MALDPMWQSNYVDLGDERTIRFGGWCIVCGARYVAPDELLDPALPSLPPPGSAAARAIEEAKFRSFVEFDTAYREMTIDCYRCGRPACPDCWDEDNRICGACVQTQGLPRSPQRGLRAGPLADGRLRRLEPGQYSEASRPGWLNQLLASQSQAGTNGGQPGASDAVWHGLSSIAPGGGPAPEPVAAPYVAPGPAASSLAAAPTASVVSGTPPPPPQLQLPPQLQPPLQVQAHAQQQTSRAAGANGYAPAPGMDAHDFGVQEGRATSNMVQCPRCGTANYDFVTRCTVCQLQLIQICPLCERLNPAHAPICEACGSPLERPHGWTGIQAPIVPLSTNQARKGKSNGSTALRPWRRILTQRPKRGSASVGANVRQAPPVNGWAQMPAAGAAYAPAGNAVAATAANTGTHAHAAASPRDYGLEQEEASALHIALEISERIASLILWAAILVLVGGIVAALVSPHADAVIKGIIHVDIRVALGNFWSWLQTLWHRYDK